MSKRHAPWRRGCKAPERSSSLDSFFNPQMPEEQVVAAVEGWIFGSHESPVHIFALFSPILFLCGTYPNLGSATSPSGARDAAR